MKQKMRIKVPMSSEKSRKKAMQVAVIANGVVSVAIEGEMKDELVVVGDGVDAACLVNALRKKLCYATLEALEEIKPNISNQNKTQVDEKSVPLQCCIAQCSVPLHCCIAQCSVPLHCCIAHQCASVSYEQPFPDKYKVVYDSYGPTTGCTIM